MQDASAEEQWAVTARESTNKTWLQMTGILPGWVRWSESEFRKAVPAAQRNLPKTTIRVVRAEEVCREKIDPSGKVASKETYVRMAGRTHEIIVPANSTARYSRGLSKVCDYAYYIPNVLITTPGQGQPAPGQLAVYPMQHGVYRVKVELYRSDARYR